MKNVHHMVLLKFKAGTPEKRMADLLVALTRLKQVWVDLNEFTMDLFA